MGVSGQGVEIDLEVFLSNHSLSGILLALSGKVKAEMSAGPAK